jgi:hypothetical protein
MKINDKHKYDVDIIEIKLFLDKISSKTFDENFVKTYNLIVNTSIGSLGLTVEEINDIEKFKYFLSVLENDLKGQLFFVLVSYQLIMVQGHRMQLVLDYHLQNTKNPDKFINQIEFFVLGLIEIYNEKLLQDERLYEITQWILKNRVKGSSEYNSSKKHLVTIDSPPIDDRIDCNEDAEYITEYFMKLNDIIGADSINPIMKKEDILHDLHI